MVYMCDWVWQLGICSTTPFRSSYYSSQEVLTRRLTSSTQLTTNTTNATFIKCAQFPANRRVTTALHSHTLGFNKVKRKRIQYSVEEKKDFTIVAILLCTCIEEKSWAITSYLRFFLLCVILFIHKLAAGQGNVSFLVLLSHQHFQISLTCFIQKIVMLWKNKDELRGQRSCGLLSSLLSFWERTKG